METIEEHRMALVAERLGELFDTSTVESKLITDGNNVGDMLVNVSGRSFLVECKRYSKVSAIEDSLKVLKRSQVGDVIPILAVDYMSAAGAEKLREAELSWMDLSGNAHIVGPGLRIVIEGRENRFKRRGRPSSAFAPKSSRVARWLLIHAGESFLQREIAVQTGLDEGYVSKIVGRLESEGFLVRNSDGGVRAKDPDLLLDAWSQDYDFGKHEIIMGHVSGPTGLATMMRVVDGLKDRMDYAVTGLAAAWMYDEFAMFRLCSVYLAGPPTNALLKEIGFREEVRGANTWLVIPKDVGVFEGGNIINGVRCVHPVQAYLDLGAQSERSHEAAQHLRSSILGWNHREADDT